MTTTDQRRLKAGRTAWILLAASLALTGPGRGEDGARVAAGIWEGQTISVPASVSAPDTSLERRIESLEKSIGELETMLGQPRGLRARQPFERRLGDAESRLDRLEKKINDIESRVRRLESRK